MFEEEKKRLKEFLAEDEAILKEYVLLGDFFVGDWPVVPAKFIPAGHMHKYKM